MNVGFYYMANAGGRLTGTVLSGLLYQWQGLELCLWVSCAFVLVAGGVSLALPAARARGRRGDAIHKLTAAVAQASQVIHVTRCALSLPYGDKSEERGWLANAAALT